MSGEFNFVDVLEKLQLTEYVDVLRANGFDTRPALELLTAEDLDAMHISKLGHRKLLLATFAESKSMRKRRFVTFAPPQYVDSSTSSTKTSTSHHVRHDASNHDDVAADDDTDAGRASEEVSQRRTQHSVCIDDDDDDGSNSDERRRRTVSESDCESAVGTDPGRAFEASVATRENRL